MKTQNQIGGKPGLSSSQISEFTRQYELRRPLQAEFTGKVVDLLKALLHVRKIDIHLIESRTKEVSSFQEKISRASKRYLSPLDEITDLSGIRIIAYYEEDLYTISELIEKEFYVDFNNSMDKRKVLKPEEFGYQSIHYVVKLSEVRGKLLEWQNFSDLHAEVQVRTVLQHAWAAISHKLQYKREGDVPQVLRRRLFRLSALLELADEEFMGLRDKTASLSQVIEEKLAGGETNIEINLLTVGEFLNTSATVGQLVIKAKQVGFSFQHYEAGELDNTSDLVAFSINIGLTLISDLEAALKESLEWSYSYLQKQREADMVEWHVSPAFVCILILIKMFREKVDLSFLLKAGWTKSIADKVIQIANE